MQVHKIQSIAFAATVFVLASLLSFVDAAEKKLEFKPQNDAKQARASARITEQQDQHRFAIELKGLEPNERYSVWLVNPKAGKDQRAGLGDPDYSFRTDASGRGRYTASVSDDALEGFERIEILRGEGDGHNPPEDVEIVLRAPLDEVKSGSE